MNIGPTRQYIPSKPLSTTTAQLIQHTDQEPVAIPNVQELLSMKSDLEALLPISKIRAQDLQKDLKSLDESTEANKENNNVQTELEQDKKYLPYYFFKKGVQDVENELSTSKKDSNSSKQTSIEVTKGKGKQVFVDQGRSESPQVKQPEPLGKAPPNQMKRKKQEDDDELDFIRVKAKDQVPLTSFWAAIEPYFRPLTEQDKTFLLKRSDTTSSYLIPPLGEHYLEQWKREDRVLQLSNEPATPQPNVRTESLVDRLLSSLVSEDILDPSELVEEEEVVETERFDTSLNIMDFEERLKRELQYSGLLKDEDSMNWNAKEDDEICVELRALGREYKEQVKTNNDRKKRLLEVVDRQLQYEQYRQVLDTLDKQVEQGYIKRFRNQKTKKNASKSSKSALSENASFAAKKRQTWINALEKIFKDQNLTMPSKTIYSSSTDGH